MKLTAFIRDVEDVYRDVRGRYENFCSDLDEVGGKLTELNKNRASFSQSGFDERKSALDLEVQAIMAQLEALPQEFAERCAAVRSNCKKKFTTKYGISPAAVDSKAIAVISSGALSLDEMKDLAASFANNRTMLRLLAREAVAQGERNGDEDVRLYGVALDSSTRTTPHLDIFDGFVTLAAKGIRVHELESSGADSAPAELPFETVRSLADGYDDELHNANLSRYTQLADNYDSE